MMKVRMLTTDASPAGVRKVGTVHNIHNTEAKDLIKGGYARLEKAVIKAKHTPSEELAAETMDNGEEDELSKTGDDPLGSDVDTDPASDNTP